MVCAMDAAAIEPANPIKTLPEGGKTTLYSRAGGCYYAIFGNQVENMTYDYLPIEVTEYDNGDVYVKDFFSTYDYAYYNEHSYIKGSKTGSTITFEFPQPVITQTWGSTTYNYYASMVEYNAAKKTFVPVTKDNTYTMTVKEDGSIVADITNDGYLFPGMIDQDNDWVYYGEVYMNLKKFTDTAVTAPADLVVSPMKAVVNETTRDVKFGISGDDAWLQGLFELAPEAWIKGKIAGDKLTFETGQYLGLTQSAKYFGYFTAAEFEASTDGSEERTIAIRPSIEFTYNAADGTYTSADNYIMVYNKNPENINYMEYLSPIVLQPVMTDISKQPKDPWNVGFIAYDPNKPDTRGQISFVGSELNVDDQSLDASKLYYRLFVNGEPYTLKKSDFYSISEDMTFVPYNYDNGNQIQKFGANHFIFNYECFEHLESVGVQICYIDGEPAEENIVAQSNVVTYPESTEDNYTPKAPANVKFHKGKGMAYGDYTTLKFDVSTVNTDGKDLDADKLYYAIYFNDSEAPKTFVKPEYYYVNPAMTYVPLNFVDYQPSGVDFMVAGDNRTVYIYDNDVTKAGVRMLYIDGEPTPENIVAQSDIVYDGDTSSISGVMSMKSVESVVYYNLAGQAVANPVGGIYIMSVKYTDGTSEIVKVTK